MPPKIKITKENIINTAVELVRKEGATAINARSVASFLGCSTQPVFSNFNTMDELHLAVTNKAMSICREYMEKEVQKGEYPVYKAYGMAYIGFAKEERELFKLLFMHDRKGSYDDSTGLFDRMTGLAQENADVDESKAQLFHLEIWACVHGIASMCATGYLELDKEFASKIVTDVYQGLKKRHKMG